MKDMITDFREKKLVDYLAPGMKVLIRFGHGLGDTMMFIPILDRLRDLYPETQIDLYVECGQEEIWHSYPVKDSEKHDLVFSLDFPMAEGSGITKTARCCELEVGIDPVEGLATLPVYDSPFVAVHFQGTALPGSVNCPEGPAKVIWDAILAVGKIPIECHFEHVFHNPVNAPYPFIGRGVRDCSATLPNLIGLLQNCGAFIGAASGPFVTALSIMPERTMLLERNHKLEDYVKDSGGTSMPVEEVTKEKIVEWLKG